MAETGTERLSSAVGPALGQFLWGGKSRHHAALSDRELLAGMARRERVALGQLDDRYAAKAFGMALSMLGSRSQSEALLAEVFWWM